MVKKSIELNEDSWNNLIECIRASQIKSKGNFWASVQCIEEQLEEED